MMNSKLARAVVVAATGLTLTVSAAACSGGGGGTSKADIVKAIKSDPSAKSLSDSQVTCIAGVIKTYIKDSAIKTVLKNPNSNLSEDNALKNKNDKKKYESALQNCAK